MPPRNLMEGFPVQIYIETIMRRPLNFARRPQKFGKGRQRTGSTSHVFTSLWVMRYLALLLCFSPLLPLTLDIVRSLSLERVATPTTLTDGRASPIPTAARLSAPISGVVRGTSCVYHTDRDAACALKTTTLWDSRASQCSPF